MAMNLDAVLRIAAKVVGLEDLGALQKGLVGVEKAAGETQQAFKAVIGSASWQAAAAGAVAVTAGLGLAVGAALKFESALADVRRVVDGIETPEALAEITREILNISSETGIAAEGITQIYAAAGQSGIARGEIEQFAEAVAMTSVAFEMTAQEAGAAMATLRSALSLGTTEVLTLAGAFNELSNKSQGSLNARQLIDFTTRVAAIGKTAGFSGQEMAAFGAVMIQNGQQSEVAATGFRNFVSALSKGPAMTDKQIDALRRLGYSFADAKQIQAELTRVAETESQRRLDIARRQGDEVVRVAEEQSRKRIELAREETEQLSREISRRYRNQLQALQDAWDDQSAASEQAIQDRTAAQVKALEREQDALVKAAQERARLTGRNADAEIQQIRDAYDARIDAIRDASDRELTLLRRADRDRQQVVRDRLQDEQDAEQKAAQGRLQAVESAETARLKAVKDGADQRFRVIEAAEKANLEAAKASAAKTGEERAKADLLAFAKRFTQDAKGVSAEVLQKLQQLPKEELYSTLVDFGGEEMARSIVTLVENFDQLSSRMAIATNDTANADSVAKEYAVKMATAAAKVAKFREQINNLGIIIGNTFLPFLAKAGEILQPFLTALAVFAKDNPAIVAGTTILAGAVAGLVLALPVIAAFITSIGIVKTALVGLNLGGLIAGWLPAIVGFVAKAGGLLVIFSQGIIIGLQAALAWIGSTFVPALIAFFSGPVGWTVLAIAAVVAMAIAFREPLMKFFTWAGQAFSNWIKSLPQQWESLKQSFANLWNQLVQGIQSALATIGSGIRYAADNWRQILYAIFIQPFINLWNLAKEPITQFLEWATGALTTGFNALIEAAYIIWVKPWADLWNNVLREPVTGTLQWLSGIWKGISDNFRQLVAEPIGKAWTDVVQALPTAMQSAANFVGRVWTGVVNSVTALVRKMLQFIADRVNSVAGLVNNVIRGFNTVSSKVNGPIINEIPIVTVPAFAEGGFVNRPTVGLVGEAGDEYIIPASKMQAASINYLNGARGSEVLSRRRTAANGLLANMQSTNRGLTTGARSVGQSRVSRPRMASTGLLANMQSTNRGLLTGARFAQGGYVNNPVLGLVGEAGPEYIVPQSKMQAASERFLSGQRGSSVIPSTGSKTQGTTSAPSINITTGPVLEFNGERYVTVRDFEKGMRMTAEGVIGRLRTPAARIALGR